MLKAVLGEKIGVCIVSLLNLARDLSDVRIHCTLPPKTSSPIIIAPAVEINPSVLRVMVVALE